MYNLKHLKTPSEGSSKLNVGIYSFANEVVPLCCAKNFKVVPIMICLIHSVHISAPSASASAVECLPPMEYSHTVGKCRWGTHQMSVAVRGKKIVLYIGTSPWLIESDPWFHCKSGELGATVCKK